jgi:hypothetical protein
LTCPSSPPRRLTTWTCCSRHHRWDRRRRTSRCSWRTQGRSKRCTGITCVSFIAKSSWFRSYSWSLKNILFVSILNLSTLLVKIQCIEAGSYWGNELGHFILGYRFYCRYFRQ